MADTEIYTPMYTPGAMLENGKYRLERMLGQGTYAEVWLATDTADGSHVAIKIKKWQLTAAITLGRFEDEKTIAMKLGKCPYIVASRGFLRWNDGAREMLAIVYEYIEGGETLRDRIFTHLASEYEALRVTSDVLRGLILAHSKGIIHRDLKPENVLLSPETDPPTAMIGDFGIAAVSNHGGDRRTRSKTQFGTPQFTAPEQWFDVRLATPRSDLFSLGVMLAEMLGVPSLVTDQDNVEVMTDEEQRGPWLARITNPRIRAVVQMATENDFVNWKVVERRFSSANIMLVAVEAAMAEIERDRKAAGLESEPPWTLRQQRESPKTEALPLGATAIPDESGIVLDQTPNPDPAPRYGTIIDRSQVIPTEDEPIPEPPSRRGWIGVLAGVVGLLVVVSVAMAFWPKEKPEVPEAPIHVAPKEEPKPVLSIVTPILKVENTPVVTVEVKPKVPPKPAAKPIVAKPKPEKPKLETAKVTTASATVTSFPKQAKVGDRIEIVAKVMIPEGATVKSVKLYYKGDAGAYQNLTLTLEGTMAKATLPINVGFGAKVEYYVDVRIEGDTVPHKSSIVTTTIDQ